MNTPNKQAELKVFHCRCDKCFNEGKAEAISEFKEKLKVKVSDTIDYLKKVDVDKHTAMNSAYAEIINDIEKTAQEIK